MSESPTAPSDREPFVSVVTVSLNAAGTIEDTLASVALQRCTSAVEHICVDGGSNDGTRGIIDHWAERFSSIRRVYERDSGIYDAMNKGLKSARGEYLLFLNADDFLVGPDTLARALEGLTPGGVGNPDLIVGDVVMSRLGTSGLWRHRRVPRLLPKLRGAGLYPVHQGVLARRRLLDAVGGFDAQLRLASDLTLYYDLEQRFPLSIRLVPEDVAFMRAGGSANAGPRAMWLGTREIYRHLLKSRSAARAGMMVLVKTLQSLAELRYGSCPQARWFTTVVPEVRGMKK